MEDWRNSTTGKKVTLPVWFDTITAVKPIPPTDKSVGILGVIL
jgi:hypothetical protein